MNIKKVYVKCKNTTEKAVAVSLFGIVANTEYVEDALNTFAKHLTVFVDKEGDVDAVGATGKYVTRDYLTGKKE